MGTLFWFFCAILLGLTPAMIASRKGRNFFVWWFYGVMLFIVALPHALVMAPAGAKKCPFCAEEIRDDAAICRHCGREQANPSALPGLPPARAAGNGVSMNASVGSVLILAALGFLFLAAIGYRYSNMAARASAEQPAPVAAASDLWHLDGKSAQPNLYTDAIGTEWNGAPTPPRLIIACEGQRLHARLQFAAARQPSAIDYKFDDAPYVRVPVRRSRAGEGEIGNGAKFAEAAAKAGSLTVRFTRTAAWPVNFVLTGLDKRLPALTTACDSKSASMPGQ